MKLKRFDRSNGNESVIDSSSEPRLVKRALEILANEYNSTPASIAEELKKNPELQLRSISYVYQLDQ